MLKRILLAGILSGSSLFMMACPQKIASNGKPDYNDAERRLRVAINVNETAYTSWNRLYENFGQLKTQGKINEARWASIQAIDGVIVLCEADLIDGIDRSKKLLDTWHKTSVSLLSAENVQDVWYLRGRELDALQKFEESVLTLTAKSVRLRDSYSEALLVTDKAVKEGLPMPTEHVNAIKQIVRMVDTEVGRKPVNQTDQSSKVASVAKQ